MSEIDFQRDSSAPPPDDNSRDQLLAAYARGERGFPRQNLAGIVLHGTDLHDCNFFDADFTGADLSGADLSRANLSHARLTNANLRGANLSDAFLDQADLAGADTTGMITDHPSAPPQPPQPKSQSGPQSVPPPVSSAPGARFCIQCGTAVPAGSRFCPVCGRVQPPSPSLSASASADSAQGATSVSASGTTMLGGTKELISALVVGAAGILMVAICSNVRPDGLTMVACALGDNGACAKAGLLNAIQQVGVVLGWLLAIAGFGLVAVAIGLYLRLRMRS